MCYGDSMKHRKRELKDDHFYHIVNRGVEKRKTFMDDEDYETFMALLEVGCERYGVRLIAVSLMPNHFHLLVWTTLGGSVSRCMQWVTGKYARLFNKRHGRSGHLWQGRFFSREVHEGRQLGTAWMYVEQNPVRSNLVDSPDKWKWSSAYLRGNKIKKDFLVEPPWWGSEVMKEWWTEGMLSSSKLTQLRLELQRPSFLDNSIHDSEHSPE